MTTTTLVTGGAGFVGSAVVRRLLEAGHRVAVLVRPGTDRRNVDGLDVALREGDLGDPASLRRALHGCAALFHVAAAYHLWHPRPAVLHRANVEGTANVLRAAREAGVERVVYTSSVATLGHGRAGEPVDETAPASLAQMIGPYKRSKFAAEEVARAFAADGLPLVVVNPTAPVGPRDRKPTPTGRLILDAAAGRMPAYVDTGLNVVHVDDVAHGHLLAFEKGRPGERYILGGTDLPLREILARIAALVGGRPPRIKLSPAWLLPLGYAAQGWARLRGGPEPRLTVAGLRMARRPMYFRSEKARAELGFTARPADEALRDAIAWYREAGMLPRVPARTR